MDRVLAEQPADTWDSFPLFQILNDYLRTDGKSVAGKWASQAPHIFPQFQVYNVSFYFASLFTILIIFRLTLANA